MSERDEGNAWLCRIIWLPFIILYMYIISVYVKFSEIGNDKCEIDSISYPDVFDSQEGWKNCTCGSEFCVGVCYCVKLFSNNKIVRYSNEKEFNDYDCTFKSTAIPYKINFQPIISKYFNKTVDCWISEDGDIYLEKNNDKKDFLIYIIVFLTLINLFCFGVEFYYCFIDYVKMTKVKVSDEESHEI